VYISQPDQTKGAYHQDANSGAKITAIGRNQKQERAGNNSENN